MTERLSRYDDIIDLPHHVSSSHPPMSRMQRAAQFSPFAALTGYGDSVEEAARYTDTYIELDEDLRSELDQRLSQAVESAEPVRIMYFVDDAHKDGGAYENCIARIVGIDEIDAAVILEDASRIEIARIVRIEFAT